MRSMISSAAGLLALSLALSVGSAQEKSAKVAASPEDAVKIAFEAMKAGDLDTALAIFPKAHGDAMRNLVKEMDAARAGVKELGEAMKAKFGDAGQLPNLPDIREQIKKEGLNLVSCAIVKTEKVSDDRVAVTTKTVKKAGEAEKTEEKTGTAIKEADGWKFLPPSMPADAKVFEAQIGRITKFNEAARKVAKEVGDGTLKSKAEAQQAFGRALAGG